MLTFHTSRTSLSQCQRIERLFFFFYRSLNRIYHVRLNRSTPLTSSYHFITRYTVVDSISYLKMYVSFLFVVVLYAHDEQVLLNNNKYCYHTAKRTEHRNITLRDFVTLLHRMFTNDRQHLIIYIDEPFYARVIISKNDRKYC